MFAEKKFKMKKEQVNESELVHLLNYEILKKWGFMWATYQDYNGKSVVTSYVAETRHTDLHNFQPIAISWFLGPNCNKIWFIDTLADKKKDRSILFRGIINSDTALRYILSSTLIFKPNNKEK